MGVMRWVLKGLQLLLLIPIYFLARLVPQKKSLWLFGAWMGQRFLDNPKHLFLEATQHHPDIKAVWLAKDRTLSNTLKARGISVVYAYGCRGFWLQIRAGLIVCTHDVQSDFVPALIGRNTRRVQTWHGIPMKKIGFDDELHQASPNRRWLVKLFFPFLEDRWNLVLAAGEADQAIYTTAFDAPLEKVIITGYPRNDEVMRQATHGTSLASGPLKIIYMPTFRGEPGSEFRLLGGAGFDFEGMDTFLKTIDAHLYIKLHPVQRFATDDLVRIEQTEQIRSITGDGDIYESIGHYDVLITDYSGIYFDFLITGKPIVLAPFDLEDYLRRDRGLYYDYPDLCPDEPCLTWEDVKNQLRRVRRGQAPSVRYQALRRRFHRYHDAGSCQRAIQQMRALAGMEPAEGLK